MLEILHEVENKLPRLLKDENIWRGVYVNYHHPFVERLWAQYGEFRIYLHRIFPCSPKDALFHPHPWPSAMRILQGQYEMAVGFGKGEKIPPVAAKIIFGPSTEYEMINPNGWHYVRPLTGSTYSLMVAGKPWKRESPKSNKPLPALDVKQRQEILQFMRSCYF